MANGNGFTLNPMEVFAPESAGPSLPPPRALLTPEMMRMLRMERLADVGAGLLEQSGYQPVAPTLGEAFGKAMRGLPKWSDVVANATQHAMQVRAAEQQLQENAAISQVLRNEVRLPGEPESMRLSRAIPKLMQLGERGRATAAQISNSLKALAPDVRDIGGALATFDPLTGQEIPGGRTPKVATYDQLSARRQQDLKNMFELQEDFQKDTVEDRIATEAWKLAVSNANIRDKNPDRTPGPRSQLDPVARSAQDMIFLNAIVNVLQPETKLQPGQLTVLQPKDTGFTLDIKKLIAIFKEKGYLTDDQREQLLDAAGNVMVRRMKSFYGESLPRALQRALEFDVDADFFTNFYEDLPRLPKGVTIAPRTVGSKSTYDQGRALLRAPKE